MILHGQWDATKGSCYQRVPLRQSLITRPIRTKMHSVVMRVATVTMMERNSTDAMRFTPVDQCVGGASLSCSQSNSWGLIQVVSSTTTMETAAPTSAPT